MIIPAAPACDIFCRVVDNFGDIGVSWRLARQLSREHGCAVRLVVDRLASFKKLVPAVDENRAEQVVEGVCILEWDEPFTPALASADLVIEAFGCELPASYVGAMAAGRRAPVWINLEYLSAETWVADHHLLPSPHPVFPLTKYFFFPGFSTGTGGLIRESSLAAEEGAYEALDSVELKIFVFAYASAPVAALLSALDKAAGKTRCTISDNILSNELKCWRGSQGENGSKGALVLDPVPFTPQSSFDHLLRGHDVLFVRGEDSLVRAIWAAKPFIWQIYSQEGDAHLAKLDAFLALYCAGLSRPAAAALRDMWRVWNRPGSESMDAAWSAFDRALSELRVHAARWSAQQAGRVDLASNLLSFYRKKAKI